MPTINIYPECPPPSWMKVGAWCYCLGEAFDKFTVYEIGKNRASLLTESGHGHGWESFRKLYRNQDELDSREPVAD